MEEAVTFDVQYKSKVVLQDIPALPTADRKRIWRAIDAKLARHPYLFGKPLRMSLTGCRSLRVGDYRIVYRIEGTVVRIYVIAHRSVVYDHAEGRMDV